MSTINTAVPGRRVAGILSCLLAGLATGAVTGADQAPAVADAAGAGHAIKLYRVVNLRSGDLSGMPSINAGNQVIFSQHTAQGSRGYFFDGDAVHDLGTLGGGSTIAAGLNDGGQVVGRSDNVRGVPRAFVWSAAAGMVELRPPPGGNQSVATAINNMGVVTGAYYGLSPRAFRWSEADGMLNLGALTSGFSSSSFGNALNDAGLIAGVSDTTQSFGHAFVWTQAGGMVDIDAFNSSYSSPAAVTSDGRVAGYYAVPGSNNRNHAFLWSADEGMRDLGTAGGVESLVIAMSDSARIAGIINLANGGQHAMYWTRQGGMVDLGTLDGSAAGAGSSARGVNNKGQVVGNARNADNTFRSFLWTARDGMVDLNTRLHNAPAGLVLEGAAAISDAGAIVATSNAGLVLLKPCCAGGGGHAMGPVAVPELVEVGAPLEASVGFVDEDRVGMRGASWSWGDGGRAQPGTLREERGAGSSGASHRYAAPGIYPVEVTLVDRGGREVTVGRQIVVYARSGGIVGGSGTIVSPQGALKGAPGQSGKASFRFVAPSTARADRKGAHGALQFHLPGWGFRSDELRPAAAGGARGQFEGRGKVNAHGDYRFALTVAAGEAATKGGFSLKVWHTDPATKAQVVDYDSRAGRPDALAGSVIDGLILQR